MTRLRLTISLPLLAFACTGGPAGSLPQTTTSSTEGPGPTSGQDPAPNDREQAAAREAPPPDREPPPPSQDPVGTGGSTAKVCIHCDTDYVCSGIANGVPLQDATLELKTKDGVCVVSQQQPEVDVLCGGQVTQGGLNIGTWKPDGEGFTVSGQGNSLVCRPAPKATPGGGGGGRVDGG